MTMRRFRSWSALLRTRRQDEPIAQRTPEATGHREEALTPAPFIVGVPRSGTTLLRLMLDAHPDLAIPPETNFIHHAKEACERASDPQQAFLETVMSHNRWGDLRIEGHLLAQRVATIEPFDLSEAMRALYKLYAEKFGKPRWGDKTPHYVRRMTLVQEVLPEAYFIHIIRDGRDVALSVKDLWFGADSVEQAARRWRGAIGRARRHSRNLSHYLEIRYGDLVSDTESTLRKVSDFVGLSWNPIMLDYHKTAGKRLRELERDRAAPDS